MIANWMEKIGQRIVWMVERVSRWKWDFFCPVDLTIVEQKRKAWDKKGLDTD